MGEEGDELICFALAEGGLERRDADEMLFEVGERCRF